MEALVYRSDDSLVSGQVVLVTVGRRKLPGIVVKKVAQPNFSTKPILKVLYSKPLPAHFLTIVRFLHEYYLTASGQAVSLILPKGVEKKRRKTEQMFGDTDEGQGLLTACPSDTLRAAQAKSSRSKEHSVSKPWPPQKTEQYLENCEIPLNQAQKNALKGLQEAPEGTKLLFGVTGSGKTNVYLKMAVNAFKRQNSTILLVPEIALTSQLVRVFRKVFGRNVVLIHSRQTEAERHMIFNSLFETKEAKIIIGPRSALFAPLSNLGLIIIDEEHETSYYQENAPRYSAIRVASLIAKKLKIPLILGSATPTIEDYYLAQQKNTLVELKEKAKPTVAPKIQIIDFKDRNDFSRNRYFCNTLLESITENLKQRRQTLIFHNRRGSAPLTICEECGEEIVCPNCFLPLTLHADKYELVCHTCEYNEKVPTNCPKCGHAGVLHKGFGTKLLESELRKLFPEARVARFDADNKRDEGLDVVYNEVRNGKIDILVGTQTLAKGLDLPKLATVGVVQADAGLSLPDYAAEERTFQLLTQVIGRVGRGHSDKAEVIIQTFRPEHEILRYATSGDYEGAAKYLLEKRRRAGFPPYRFVAKLEIILKTESLVIKKIRETADRLSKDKELVVSPPEPAFHERTIHGYAWQLIVRARSRKKLVASLGNLDPNFKITFDPPSLL